MFAPPRSDPAEFDRLLQQTEGTMSPWQARAMLRGTLASTSFQLGPQHIIDRIFADGLPAKDIDEAKEVLRIVMGEWNTLNTMRCEGVVKLSELSLSEPPTVDEIRAIAERRQEEVLWFIRGLDAGGDLPNELGDEGEELHRGLAEGSAFAASYVRFLDEQKTEPTQKELRDAVTNLQGITSTLERIMLRLSELSDDARAAAMAEMGHLSQRRTADDGAPVRVTKIGRNAPCPCGSGKKYKKCCGAEAPRSIH